MRSKIAFKMGFVVICLLFGTQSILAVEGWTALGPNKASDLAVSPLYPDDQTIVVTQSGYYPPLVYVTKDFGVTWQEKNIALAWNGGFTGVDIDETTNRVYVSGINGAGTFASDDGGLTWNTITQLNTWDIDAVSNNVFLAADGVIAISSDGGASFSLIGPNQNGLPSNPGQFFTIAASPNYAMDRTIFAGAGWTGMFKSTDGGAHWSQINNGLPQFDGSLTISPTDIAVSPNYANDHTVFATIHSSGIYRSTDGGSTWVRAIDTWIMGYPDIEFSPAFAEDGVVGFSGLGNHEVGGEFHPVWISRDRGVSWKAMDSVGPEGVSSLVISPNFHADQQVFIGTGSGVYVGTAPLDQPPVLEPIGDQSINEGTSFRYSLSASDPEGDVVTYSAADLPAGATLDPSTGTFSWEPQYNQAGLYQVTFIASASGGSDSETVTFTVNNVNLNPIAYAGVDQWLAVPGASVTLDGSGSYDPDGGPLTYQWALIAKPAAFSWGEPPDLNAAIVSFTPSCVGDYQWQLTVSDSAGGTSLPDTVRISVNELPSVLIITPRQNPIPIGTGVTMSATFADANSGDTHTAMWEWGDGSTSVGQMDEGNRIVTGSHPSSYSSIGAYPVTLTIDDRTGEGKGVYQYIVIYNPLAGYVAGHGQIYSPAGAYLADTSLKGPATFGFSSKYVKGTNIPDGNTRFRFHVADLNFVSTGYEWLLVSGAKASYKGAGTINGQGSYKFMLSAIDADQNTADAFTFDRFRIRIWSENAGGERKVYDNGLGTDVDQNSATNIVKGEIDVRKDAV